MHEQAALPAPCPQPSTISKSTGLLLLAAAGLTLRDVVKVTSYVHDPADGPLYNTLYREYFSPPYPARTTLMNCLSSALKFEVDIIAVRPV